jgi:plastocyanin
MEEEGKVRFLTRLRKGCYKITMRKMISYFPGTILLVFILGAVFYFIAIDDPLNRANEQERVSILPNASQVARDIFNESSGEEKTVIIPRPVPKDLSVPSSSQSNDIANSTTGDKKEDNITHTVFIENDTFNPRIVVINTGDTVKWINNDTRLHWPSSDPHPTHTGLVGFDPLADLRPGESFSYKFTDPGVYGYHDHTQAIIGGIATLTGIVNVLEDK